MPHHLSSAKHTAPPKPGGGTRQSPSGGGGGGRRSSNSSPYGGGANTGRGGGGNTNRRPSGQPLHPHETSMDDPRAFSVTPGGTESTTPSQRRKKQRPHPVHARVLDCPELVYVVAPRFVHHAPDPEAAARAAMARIHATGDVQVHHPPTDSPRSAGGNSDDSPSKSSHQSREKPPQPRGAEWLFLCPTAHPDAATPPFPVPRVPADVPTPPPVPSPNDGAAVASASNTNIGQPPPPTTTCAAGDKCPYVHATLTYAAIYRSHIWDNRWASLSDVNAARFESGLHFDVALPNGKEVAERVRSELCLKTRALSSERRPLSHCAHFVGKGVCDLGSECLFVHYVGRVAGVVPTPIRAADAAAPPRPQPAAAAPPTGAPTTQGPAPNVDVSLPNSRKGSLAPSPAIATTGTAPPGLNRSSSFSGLLSPSNASNQHGASGPAQASTGLPMLPPRANEGLATANAGATHVLLSGFAAAPPRSTGEQQARASASAHNSPSGALGGTQPPSGTGSGTAVASPANPGQRPPSSPPPSQQLPQQPQPMPHPQVPQLMMLPNGQLVQVAPVDPALLQQLQQMQQQQLQRQQQPMQHAGFVPAGMVPMGGWGVAPPHAMPFAGMPPQASAQPMFFGMPPGATPMMPQQAAAQASAPSPPGAGSPQDGDITRDASPAPIATQSPHPGPPSRLLSPSSTHGGDNPSPSQASAATSGGMGLQMLPGVHLGTRASPSGGPP